MPKSPIHARPTGLAAWRISLGYALAGTLWLLGSGAILHRLAPNPGRAALEVSVIGYCLVIITALGLGLALNRYFREIRRSTALLRQSEERLNFALEQSQTGGWDLDLVNHTAHRTLQHDRIFGYDALLPQWSYELFLEHVLPEDRAEVVRRFSQALAAQTDWSFECRIRRRDGQVRWIWAAGGHQRDSSAPVHRMAGIVQDITARKQAEQALAENQRFLAELNRTLDQRVHERTAELRAANQELDAFAHAVSHDLRAPLRAMNGFSQALLEDYTPILPPAAREYLREIQLGSQHLGELIDGLLRLSRNTRGDLHREVVDLSAAATRILDQLRAAGPPRAVSWTVEPNLTANGDPRLLEAVLTNLLTNAWKYTARSPQAVIRVYGQANEHETICSVADNGAGFDMKHAAKLFQPFQRFHREDEFPGLGIGLATVHRILRRHGGDIHAAAAPGAGATFTFRLPKADLGDAANS